MKAELDQLKADLSEAHRKQLKTNEEAAVASMELSTLRSSLDGKAREVDDLNARLKAHEEAHSKETAVSTSQLVPNSS